MTEHGSKDGTREHGSGVGHERIELNVAPVVWFLIGLSVAAVLIFLLITVLFNALQTKEEKSAGAESPLASERQKLPPEPRLQLAPSSVEQLEGKPPNLKQDHPLAEMKRLRAEEDEALNSYGWVDQNQGIARIPIEQAKKRLLEKGIATRK